ncbi:MAG: hypothetical protein MZU95_09060 [Desulfomicrobium escambiense]|nr:hypothetical protein [Desulfomicrobium escambiense]
MENGRRVKSTAGRSLEGPFGVMDPFPVCQNQAIRAGDSFSGQLDLKGSSGISGSRKPLGYGSSGQGKFRAYKASSFNLEMTLGTFALVGIQQEPETRRSGLAGDVFNRELNHHSIRLRGTPLERRKPKD